MLDQTDLCPEVHETGHLILGKLDLAEVELAKTLNKASWMDG